MKRKTQHNILLSLILVIIFGSTAIGYFLFLDGTVFRKPIEISSIKVLDQHYRPGQLVAALVSYCAYRSIPFTLEWSLLDERKIFYVADENQLWPMGCFKNVLVNIKKLPPTLPADTYEFLGSISLPSNGIRDINVQFKTNQFLVK